MIKFTQLKPVELSASDAARARSETERLLMAHGASAFALGAPISNCPPFAHENMAWAWRQGWRNAQEDKARREQARQA